MTVSSLQQLLALKNRVLMALQQHGIGKSAQKAGGANSASAGAPAAQGGAPAQAGAGNSGAPGGQFELTPVSMGVLAAIVVVLLALFARLLTRKRRNPADQAPEEAASATPEVAPAAPVVEAPPVLHEPIARAEEQPRANESAAPAALKADEVTITPVPTPAVTSEPLEHSETLDDATRAASLDAAASLGADALPPTLSEPLEPVATQEPPIAQASPEPHDEHAQGLEPAEPHTLDDATEAASLEAAAEPGASALPPESLDAARGVEHAEMVVPPAPIVAPQSAAPVTPATPEIALDFGGDDAPHAPQAEALVSHPQNEIEATREETHETEAFRRPAAPSIEPEIPAAPAVPEQDMNYAEVPTEFPQDAVHALGGIDMPLPPRVGEPVVPTEPLSTEPVATPEALARLASPFHDDEPSPLAGQAIETGTAGVGALAGLGAPRFGALTLDFDLNLPPDSAEPLPVFTSEQLARIARNKLDLAHEYIALGDVAGARSLINEVIESNDHATRSDAQALLSTLAPLS